MYPIWSGLPWHVEEVGHRSRSVNTLAYDRLRELLAEAREGAGLTQRQVSRLLGQGSSYTNKVETGYRRLDVVEFVQLCDALRIDPHAMLTQIESEIKKY